MEGSTNEAFKCAKLRMQAAPLLRASIISVHEMSASNILSREQLLGDANER